VTHSAQASWLTLTTNAGTGSGTLRWTRDPSGLGDGLYIDTLVVSVAGAVGSPARVIDTLEITGAPLALALSPTSRRDTAQSGSTALRADSADVSLTGAGSNAATWTVAHSAQASWVTLTNAGGTGSGKLLWTRNPAGLAAGTYVDTLTVTAAGASGSPARLVDTFEITPAPPLVLSVNPASQSISLPSGSTTPAADSADVSLTGSGASTATWTATHSAQASWVTLTNAGGTGSGKLRWTRNPTSLAVGTYVDTLTVTAAGATGSPARVIDSLVITQAPGTSLSLALVTANVNRPIFLTAPPGDPTRLFIVEQTGRIRIVKNGSLLSGSFLDLSGQISSTGERGLLGLAFHPQYAQNGVFVVNYTDTNGDTQISRFTVSANPDVANAGSEQVVLSVGQPASNHNAGMVAFGPDGYLYVALGDGGGGGDPFDNGQDRTTLLGSLLRIDIDGGTPYAIPSTNPYASSQTFRQEIWSYGLRNPWRFSFDRLTGDLYIGDVGQNAREEIDVQPASSMGGENYGWNIMEGNICFSPSTGCNQSGLTLPALDYTHAIGCSVTGGYVYRGSAIPAIQGRYFYGDFCGGWIRSFLYQNGQVSEETQWLTGVGSITSFGEDALGELYVTVSSGSVYKIQSP
jgi:glucose/arabinose dehydrogenase